MKRLSLFLAATALTASPALAQQSGHSMQGMSMPGMTMPMPAKKPAAKKASPAPKKKTAAKKPAAKKGGAAKTAKAAAGKPAARATASDQHDMTNMPGMTTPADPNSGQDMSQMPGMAMPADPHAGHDMAPMPGMAAPEPPLGPPPAAAFKGPQNAADTVWGGAAMDPSRTFLLTREHGAMRVAKLLIDQAETRIRNGRDGYFVNAEGWYGGDIDKLWLKTEIEGAYGSKPGQAEVQALWSHAIDPWFNLQTGVRIDTEPRTTGRLAVGVEGLAPYWIEVDGAAFLSTRGDLTARFEAKHDLRITQKLLLQPRGQLDFALHDIPEERVGSGLSKVELGARLRYQITPNFAPYIGIVYERAIGHTARFVRAAGDDPGGLEFAVGVRTWF